MRLKRKLKLVLVVATLLILGNLLPARTQAATTWQLVQLFPGSVCGSYRDGSTPSPTVWILLTLSGTWTHPVNFGIRNPPPGTTVGRSTFVNGNPVPYQPIAPGSGDGTGGALGRVELTYHQGTTPPGTYSATLWANDGTTERTLPVTLVVKVEKCSRY
jgi:hypothetical protein